MIVASACLLGLKCCWDGQIYPKEKQLPYFPGVIPVCPEQLGGLTTPREPAQIFGGNGFDVLHGQARVVTVSGIDVTREFILGAQEVLKMARQYEVNKAVLKDRSPSCGVQQIYRGQTLVTGMGVTCALLLQEGFKVLSSEETDKLNA